MSLLGLGNKLGQCQVGVGAGNHVYFVSVYKLLFHALGHTADYSHKGLFAATHGVQLVQTAINFLLGIVAYRTGVQQNKVGLFNVVAHFVSGYTQDGTNNLAVGHIHLAAVCLYE